MSKASYLSVLYDERVKPVTTYPHHLADYLAQRFSIEKGSSVLDAGCGRGEMLDALSRLGMDVSGCDLEPPTDSTPFKIEKVDFAVEALPYEDNAFDLVISKSVVEHIPDPTHHFLQLYRVLKPGGTLLAFAPDWVSQMAVFYDDPTHVHPYTPKGLQNLLSLSGFTKVGVERFSHHEWLWRSGFWRAIARLLRLCIKTPTARSLSQATGVKFLRWSVELNILAHGTK